MKGVHDETIFFSRLPSRWTQMALEGASGPVSSTTILVVVCWVCGSVFLTNRRPSFNFKAFYFPIF